MRIYLVALSSLAGATAHGAVAGDVTGLAALVAGLVVLHGLSAVTACRGLAIAKKKGGNVKRTHVALAYSETG